MIAVDEHPAGLADRRGAKPRSGPVRRAEVERDAGHADSGVSVRPLDAEKGRPDSKSRNRGHGLISCEVGVWFKINELRPS